jgi:hypothetical protein
MLEKAASSSMTVTTQERYLVTAMNEDLLRPAAPLSRLFLIPLVAGYPDFGLELFCMKCFVFFSVL